MKKLLKILTVVLAVSVLALTFVACHEDPCKDGHTWDEGTVTKAPTCTDKGEKTFHCTVCDKDDAVKTEEIAALGHALGTLHPATGTCTTGRTLEYYDCANGCGNKLDADKNVIADIDVAPGAHSFGSEIAAVEASCTQAGMLAHYECTVCHVKAVKDGDNYVEKSDAELIQAQLAHTWGDEIPEKPATCFEPGMLAHYECSVCHVKAIKDGVNYVEKTDAQLVIAQSVHNCATTVNHCDVCNTDLTEDQILDALFALGTGEKLKGTYMLEGMVTKVENWSADFGNIEATLQVGDKIVLAYRLVCASEDAVQAGQRIQVTGSLIDYNGTKEFEAGCTFVRVLTDEEKVAADKAAITLSAKYSESFDLPLEGANGTAISWAVTVGAELVTIEGGRATVTAPDADTSVTLTATITLNDAFDTREFTITISAVPLVNYTLTWTEPEHATLRVSANGSDLTSGASLAEGTAVTVVVTLEKGYKLTSYTVNEEAPITAITDNTFVIDIETDTTFAVLIENKYNVVTIAQFMALANGAQGYQITGVVTNINGTKNYYIQDANGDAIYVYANKQTQYLTGVEIGKQITVAGSKSIYNGLHQIAPSEMIAITDGTLPEALVLDEAAYVALAVKDASKLVTLNNVVFVGGTPSETAGFNANFKIGATQITVRIETDLAECSKIIRALKEGDVVNLVGVNVGWFNGKQIAVTNAAQMVVCRHENTTATPEVPAANPCVDHGTAAYWTCNDCGCKFMDAECTILATEQLLTLPLAEHRYDYVSDNAGQHTGTCSVCGGSVTEPCDTNGTNGEGQICCSKCGYVKAGATYVGVSVTYVVDGAAATADAPANLEIGWTLEEIALQGEVTSLECGKTYYVSFNLNDKYTFVSVSIAGNTDTEQKANYEVAVSADATETIEIVVTVNKVVVTGPVTIDLTAQGYVNAEEVTTVSEKGVTVTFDKGSNTNTPKYYTTGNAVRVYGGGYFTVSSENTIRKITITFSSGEGTNAISVDKGSFSTNVWIGAETAVKFTVGGTSGHRRIAKIVIEF